MRKCAKFYSSVIAWRDAEQLLKEYNSSLQNNRRRKGRSPRKPNFVQRLTRRRRSSSPPKREQRSASPLTHTNSQALSTELLTDSRLVTSPSTAPGSVVEPLSTNASPSRVRRARADARFLSKSVSIDAFGRITQEGDDDDDDNVSVASLPPPPVPPRPSPLKSLSNEGAAMNRSASTSTLTARKPGRPRRGVVGSRTPPLSPTLAPSRASRTSREFSDAQLIEARTLTSGKLEFERAAFKLGSKAVATALFVDELRDEVLFAGSDTTVGVWSPPLNAIESRFRVATTSGDNVQSSALCLLNRTSNEPLMVTFSDVSNGDACARVWRGYHSPDSAQLSACWPLSWSDDVVDRSVGNIAVNNDTSSPSTTRLSPAGIVDHSSTAAVSMAGVCYRETSGALCAARGRRVLLFDCHAERQVWQHDAAPEASLCSSIYTDVTGCNIIYGCRNGDCFVIDARLRPSSAITLHLKANTKADRDVDSNPGPVLSLGVPFLRPNTLIGIHRDGVVRQWDTRGNSSTPSSAFVGLEKSGGASCGAVHATLPLCAVGSANQRLRLCHVDGHVLHELKNHRFAGARLGAVALIAFHKFRPELVIGAADGCSYHACNNIDW